MEWHLSGAPSWFSRIVTSTIVCPISSTCWCTSRLGSWRAKRFQRSFSHGYLNGCLPAMSEKVELVTMEKSWSSGQIFRRNLKRKFFIINGSCSYLNNMCVENYDLKKNWILAAKSYIYKNLRKKNSEILSNSICAK